MASDASTESVGNRALRQGRRSPISIPLYMIPRLLAALLLLLLTPAVACAQSSEQVVEKCFAAYEQTQVLLKTGDFQNAQLSAEVCSTACPEEIMAECSAWSAQIKRDMPSVVLLARSSSGIDADGISVKIDGLSEDSVRPNEPISLNPGPHSLSFSRNDGWKEVIEIVVHKGEQMRQIRVTVPDRSPSDPFAPPGKKASSTKGWTIASFTLSGLGFAAAATGGIVALSIKGKLSDCDNVCSASRIERLETHGKSWLLVGDIGLIAGSVGALSGVAFLIWGNSSEPTAPSAQLRLLPAAGGGAGIVTGTF